MFAVVVVVGKAKEVLARRLRVRRLGSCIFVCFLGGFGGVIW